MLFSGYKKIVLDIFGGRRGLNCCSLVFDILEGQNKGGVQWSATQEAGAKTAENSSTQNRKISTNNKSQAETSCTNNKEHQTAATQEKSTNRISRSSTRSSQHKHENSSKSCTTSKQQRKQQKQQRRHEGPEGGASGLFVFSVASSRVFFGGVFEAFFEIPVNSMTIGY